MVNLRFIVSSILRFLFLALIVSFIVLRIIQATTSVDLFWTVHVLFFVFMLDIYLLFVLFATTVTYLEKKTKEILIAGSTGLFLMSIVFLIIGMATQMWIFYVLVVLIGLPGMLGFSAYLRNKRGSIKSQYDDII